MRVLFIGGTGVISTACTRVAAERGMSVTLLTRGVSERPVPAGVRVLRGDIRDAASARAVLAGETFDAVVDWVAFSPEHVETDLDLFRGRTGQYVFVSSASAYETPPRALPVTEQTPLSNPLWAYSRAKIAAEARLMQAFRDEAFPVTIVRPSHTVDETRLPTAGYYTSVARMRRGAPVVVHGDGASLWTLTHSDDFARAFVGLLGAPAALGEAYTITSDEWLTWDEIYRTVARAAGAGEPEIVHIPSDVVARFDAVWGETLLGDKAHSRIFDTSKIKAAVPGWRAEIPFARSAERSMAWFDADPARRVVDADLDRTMDRIVAAMRGIG